LPSVAFNSPPIVSPVLAATDSVAMLSNAASGTMAKIDSKNSAVCASGRKCSAASTTGTKTSSQSSGMRRIAAEQLHRSPLPGQQRAASIRAGTDGRT
jgi:hypothetical protein